MRLRPAFSKKKRVVVPSKIVTAKREGRPVRKQRAAVGAKISGQSVNWEALLAGLNGGRLVLEFGANRNIFLQGQSAESVYYIRRGQVRLSVTSQQGKEAIVAVLNAGDFFGEGCLAGQSVRIATAMA